MPWANQNLRLGWKVTGSPFYGLSWHRRFTEGWPSQVRLCAERASLGSTEIVGVGLKLQPDWSGRDHVVFEAVPVAISDRRILGLEGNPHLRIGVAGPV